MSLLNRPSDGLLSIVIVFWRALKVYGPLSRDQLLSLCVPDTLIMDANHKKQGPQTLTRWLQIGLIVENPEGLLELKEPFAALDVDNLEGFRTELLRLVLHSEDSRTEGTGGEDEDKSLANDFIRAAAWSLGQDPFALSKSKDKVDFSNSQQVRPPVFQHRDRWTGYEEWAYFLGLGVRFEQDGFFLIPTRAIRDALPKSLSPNIRTEVSDFVEALANCLPIVDQGRYAKEIAMQTEKPWRTFSEHELSPCLSLALLQLQHEGVVRLEDLADSSRRFSMLGKEGRVVRSVTHVIREAS